MKEEFILEATARDVKGKGASRRLRHLEARVPAIIYGDNKEPAMISVEHKALVKHLEQESFYSQIIAIRVGKKSEAVILKDLQRHPSKPLVLHADFLRVSKSKKITVNVPVHFLNEETCVGVKQGGGSILRNMTELEVSCLPNDLPEFIEVDVQDVEVGQTLHISDLTLPKGVESVSLSHGGDHDLPVVTVNKPRGGSSDDDAEAENEEA